MVVQALIDGAKPGTPLTAEQISKASGTALVGDAAGLQAVDPKGSRQACEWVSSLIVADDAKGTVTLNLAQPWGPFLPTLANTWGSVMDKKWVADNKGWDGSCDTWQNFYGVHRRKQPDQRHRKRHRPLQAEPMDQGPGDRPGAVDDYWRTEPAWEGGPTGAPPSSRTSSSRSCREWGTRFAMLQAGDADFANVPRANTSQVCPWWASNAITHAETAGFTLASRPDTPDQPLRPGQGAPANSPRIACVQLQRSTPRAATPISAAASWMAKASRPISSRTCTSARRFQYCFNWDTFIQRCLGLARRSSPITLPLPGMPGYSQHMRRTTPSTLDKCDEEFKAST